MNKNKKWLLLLFSILYIFTFSGCTEVGDLTSIHGIEIPLFCEESEDEKEFSPCFDGTENKTEAMSYYEEDEPSTSNDEIEVLTTDCGDESIPIEFVGIGGPFMYIHNLEDISLDDFTNCPMLSAQENETVQRAIVDIILYTFGFEINLANIFPMINEEVSKDWFAIVFEVWISQFPEDIGMTILDKIYRIRNDHVESSISLDAIQLNFMMRSYRVSNYILQGDFFFVSVPIWRSIDGLELGYMLYDFVFKEIDGSFFIIGLAINA